MATTSFEWIPDHEYEGGGRGWGEGEGEGEGEEEEEEEEEKIVMVSIHFFTRIILGPMLYIFDSLCTDHFRSLSEIPSSLSTLSRR